MADLQGLSGVFRRRGGCGADRLADQRRDFGSVKLDRPHDLGVRHHADRHLQQEAVVAEKRVLGDDLLGHRLGVADEKGAARRTGLVEMGAACRSPSPLAADAVHHLRLRAVEIVGRLLGRVADEAVHIDARGKPRRIVAAAPRRLPIELEQRREARRLAADDGERQRQPEHARARDGLRRAADRDPDRQAA